MRKLVSSGEAASILGLSLQGVHYRIKKGQLESVKKDGKIYVYVDSSIIKAAPQTNNNTTTQQSVQNPPIHKELEALNKLALKSKDEQILTLKKTIKFMKRQYQSEIDRLDKNQQQILSVFQSEVDLLKSAFHEMKSIYQVEHKTVKNEPSHKIGMEFMDLKDFFIFMRQNNKSDFETKKIILEKVKAGDKRFIYNRATKEVLIYKNDFLDLI